MKKKLKNPRYAVGYCRYSSDNQREESITAQKREIQKWADDNNVIIITWYIDRATTGTNADREEWKKLKEDSANGNFGLCLVHKENRFSRQQVDEQYKEEKDLLDNGVRLLSVTERFENNPSGRMAKGVNRVINAWYCDNLAQEVIKGKKENVYGGKNIGGFVPFGYKLEPIRDPITGDFLLERDRIKNKLIIHPQQSEAVKIMFDMTLKGYKRFEIIDRLNALGYTRTVYIGKGRNRPKMETDFTGAGTVIDYVLRNPKYAGIYIMRYNKKEWDFDPDKDFVINDGGYPAIISKETFEAVQQILKQRVKNPSHVKEEYLLSGKIICGECNTPYSGARQVKNGKSYARYQCNRQTTYKHGSHLAEHCHNNTVTRDKIEKYVIKQVSKILYSEKAIDKVLEEYNRFAAEANNNSTLIEMYESQIKNVDKKIKHLIDAITSGFINENLQAELNRLEAEKKKIADIIAQEKKTIVYFPATKEELVQVYRKAQEQLLNGSFEERKLILNLFVNKIVIFRQSVEIYINLIPASHLSGIDLSVVANEYLGIINEKNNENNQNTLENSEITTADIEKDGYNPSSSIPPLYSDNFFGSPGRI